MRSTCPDSDRIFTLDDIRRLIVRSRRMLVRAAWMGALFGLLAAIVRPPLYKIQATFKEGTEHAGIEYSMKDLLLTGLKAAQEPQALALMQSRCVILPVLEKYGIQAQVERSFLFEHFRSLRNHLLAQFSKPLPEMDWFRFGQVHYGGQRPLLLTLRFQDKNRFQVFDASGALLANAVVGKPVCLDQMAFTCERVASDLRLHTSYSLRVLPRKEAEKRLHKNFRIAKHKSCPSIYDLSFYWPDRSLGADILNALMEEYRTYLKRDRDEIAVEQVAYLQIKQEEICKRFETLFDNHAAYLAAAMKEKGWIGLEQEMRSYLEPHEEMRTRVLAIDMQLERLQRPDLDYQETALAKELEPLFQQLRDLTQERGILLQSLPSSDLVAQGMHLSTIREPHMPWERAAIGEGIDLESARVLQSEYAARLDAAEASRALIRSFKDKLQESEFDVSSLANVFKDPLSQTLIAKAAEVSLQLKEVEYSSVKEQQRWREEIEWRKNSLLEHLTQMEKVEELNEQMHREKIAALQRTALDGIERQVGVLQKEIRLATAQKITHLQDEKKLLEKKMEQLRSLAADLPQRWKIETWLQLKTDMGKKMMTAMAELVESKTIGRHLLHIESKPLDTAEAPLFAVRSFLFPFLFLGAFVAVFAVFWVLFLKQLCKGFPLTGPKIQTLGYPYSGELSPWCDGFDADALQTGDLETLRRIGLFLESEPRAKIVALIGREGPNYSYSLAQNLQRIGKRVCIVDCDFRSPFTSDDKPGLLQWIQGDIDTLPIRKGSVDRIASGGFSSYGCELFQKERFRQGLDSLQNSYDYIFLWQRAALDSADAKILLRESHKTIASIAGEQTEQLTPLLNWAYHDGNSRINFISFP